MVVLVYGNQTEKACMGFRRYIPVLAIIILLVLILADIKEQQTATTTKQNQKEDAVMERDLQVHHDADRYGNW
jgi:hypothetical protein